MYQKYWFYMYPVKVGQFLLKNHRFRKRDGEFEGGGEREPTHTHAFMFWEVGSGCLEGWRVVVVVGERRGRGRRERIIIAYELHPGR